MAGQRRLRLLGRLVGSGAQLDVKRLCEVSAEVTGTSGGGIMVTADDVPAGSICSTDRPSAVVEELQFALGEGPCVDAYNGGRPVSEPDLAAPANPRWLAFSGPALDAGVRAVFGLPLRVGAIRLGSLNLYRDEAGELSDEEHADGLTMADIVSETLLVLQANAPPGTLAQELEVGADFHYVVHQASGMVAAQLDISVGQALIRLRAYAFGNERALSDVAEEVVARILRFDGPGERDQAL